MPQARRLPHGRTAKPLSSLESLRVGGTSFAAEKRRFSRLRLDHGLPGTIDGFQSRSQRVALLCLIVRGVFTPVLAKHSKSFSLIDCISVGVDRMQRNFEPMRKQVEAWQKSELTDVTAKVVIYEAFVEGRLEAPKHLTRTVHDLYFEPKYEEFRPRAIWSLSNAFTSAFKELDPIPQFKATAKLGEFLEAQFSHSF